MAPGAKRERESLDHALASFPAPASGTRGDLRVIRLRSGEFIQRRTPARAPVAPASTLTRGVRLATHALLLDSGVELEDVR